MRRRAPMALCFIFGVVMAILSFSPHGTSQAIFNNVIQWGLVIGPFAFVLGLATLVKMHITRIKRRSDNWQYSFVVFFGLILMASVGLIWGQDDAKFEWLFNNIQVPMEATMFSLLAFFIASAAYRAFRARTLEATLLLVAAIILMFGNAPIGNVLWNKFIGVIPDAPRKAGQWILNNPNLSSRRGIIIGLGLGAISQSLRIILGIERSYLGGRD